MGKKDPVKIEFLEPAQGAEVRIQVLDCTARCSQDDVAADECLFLLDQEAYVVVEMPRCEQSAQRQSIFNLERLPLDDRLDLVTE